MSWGVPQPGLTPRPQGGASLGFLHCAEGSCLSEVSGQHPWVFGQLSLRCPFHSGPAFLPPETPGLHSPILHTPGGSGRKAAVRPVAQEGPLGLTLQTIIHLTLYTESNICPGGDRIGVWDSVPRMVMAPWLRGRGPHGLKSSQAQPGGFTNGWRCCCC
jgi:hypothetical protein